jgi:hypothetical protein
MRHELSLKIENVQITGDICKRIGIFAKAWDVTFNELVHQLLFSALENKDQTDPKGLEASEFDDLGTGLFLIPDVQKEELDAQLKVFVPDITYHECIKRGKHTMAFRWIPHMIMTFEELTAERCDV